MEPLRKRRHETQLGVDKPSKEQQWPPALMQQGCDWLRDWAPALQAAGQWPGGVQRWPFYVVVPNSFEFQSQGSNLLLQPPTPLPSAAAPPLEASLPSALSPSSSGHSRHSNPSTPPQRSAQQAAAGGRPPRAKHARSAAAAEPSGLDALLAAAASLERSDGGAAEAAASPAATPGAAEQLWGCPSRQPPRGSSWAAGAAAAALPPRSVGPAVARQQQQQLLQAAQSLLGYLNAHPAAAAPQPQPQPRQETVQQRKRKEPPAAACSAGAEPSLDAQQGIPSWLGLAGREGSMSDTSTGPQGFAFPASAQHTASPARLAPAAAGAAPGAPCAGAAGAPPAASKGAKGAKRASPLLPAELAALPPELACKAAALVPLLEQGMGLIQPLPGGQPRLSPQLTAQLAEAMNSTARAVVLAAQRAYRAQARGARAARLAAARG